MNKKDELQQGLYVLRNKLKCVIDCAEDLYEASQDFRCFGGQLDSYFIGWMKAFLNNKNQPGSIATLQRLLDDDEDGYNIEK